MPTPTTNMGLLKPDPGDDTGLWGGYLNGDLDLLDLLARFPVETHVQFGANNLQYDQVSPIVVALGIAGGTDLPLFLPSATAQSGKVFLVIKSDSGLGTVTISTVGGQTINNSFSYVLTAQFKNVALLSDGANWLIVFSN